MKKTLSLSLLLIVGIIPMSRGASAQPAPSQNSTSVNPENTAANVALSSTHFDSLADAALLAMRQKAEQLKIGGAAVVAYFEGDAITSWSSRMVIVGRIKDEPSATGKGANLLAIAYAKASEMADTLRNSGSQSRAPLTGEFGWEGGVIARTKTGYVLAAFSGGQSADDAAVSRAGITALVAAASASTGPAGSATRAGSSGKHD